MEGVTKEAIVECLEEEEEEVEEDEEECISGFFVFGTGKEIFAKECDRRGTSAGNDKWVMFEFGITTLAAIEKKEEGGRVFNFYGSNC